MCAFLLILSYYKIDDRPPKRPRGCAEEVKRGRLSTPKRHRRIAARSQSLKRYGLSIDGAHQSINPFSNHSSADFKHSIHFISDLTKSGLCKV